MDEKPAAETPVVLYEDNHCLALAKPAPLLTQAPSGIPSLEAMAKAYLKERYHKKGHVYLGVPHRLDRPVSGVVLFARNTKAARRLAEQFQLRQVSKIYWAAVEGELEPPAAVPGAEETFGIWEDWIRKIKEESRAERVPEGTEGARRAVLRYRPLQACRGGTLVEFQPQTGRMHQIRLQTALRGHPIQGDVLYGSRLPFGPSPALPRDRVIALHARRLTFLHPIRYEPTTVTAPLPGYWEPLGIKPGAFEL